MINTLKAKYLMSEQKLEVCSRCAISLVEKGYKIQELEMQNGKRDLEINNFLKEIEVKVPKLENMMLRLRMSKENFMQFC